MAEVYECGIERLMKIVLDARGIRSGMTGVGHYTRLLADALCAARPRDSFVFLTLRGQDPALRPPRALEAANAEWLEVDVDPESHPKGDYWMHRTLPRLLDELEADVFHGPAFQVPFGRRKPRAARVVTIHDLSVFTMPEAYPMKFRLYLRRAIARSAAAADRVICLTDFGRRQAHEIFPEEPRDKFIALHSAAADIFQPPDPRLSPPPFSADFRRRLQLPPTFILMVGTFETRKNPEFFLKLYEKMLQRKRDEEKSEKTWPPVLVWAGAAGHGADRFLPKFENLRRKGLFRRIEDVRWDELPSLYQSARALVYPSHHEGFGLPLLEAMACGLPVLAAPTTCLPEVVGDGGTILPLDRRDLWTDAIAELVEDPDRHSRASRKALDRARAFSWSRTAQGTARVYKEALER